MSQTVDRFVKQGFRGAAPYNAEHHDFAWQHRQLARMMSNECPIPPSEGVRAAVRERLDLYKKQTAPLIVWFTDRNKLVTVDGNAELDVVTSALIAAVDERLG